MLRDLHPLRRLRERNPVAYEQRLAESREQLALRASSVPTVDYPAQLPITEHVDEIKRLLSEHQVIVVAGETGSGKTTQLPKICLAAGYGVRGLIGHTQPRRIAARAVAARVAEELNVEPGSSVGYSVRFSDQASDETLVKLMTDGILLTEIRHDRFLNAYEVLIIDEAHERSLNIDFLLGYLQTLLRKRPDLKLIITSATIDESAFAAHFGDAPIVRVSGRSYPVEIRYIDEGLEQQAQLERCFKEIRQLNRRSEARDVLLFASGEREILDNARWLRKHLGNGWEVLPLYARLSANEQAKIFRTSTKPRVVIATNVAETSLTVPNIGFVIDPGLARLSRYSYRSKLQRLPIEPISQASATQRAGRCGRIAPGVCFRLFDEADFVARPGFTEPEIQRSNLAAVVLQMRAFKLGDIRRFPFINPPASKAISDAERLLEELGALKLTVKASPAQQGNGNSTGLTKVGQTMARLPVDPRLGRMLIAAHEFGSLAELLVITAALASGDPRERPLANQQAADTAHEMFADERSDFLVFLNIWRWAESQRTQLGSSALNRAFKKRFLSNQRMREWRSLHRQLKSSCADCGLRTQDAAAGYAAIHQALISGSLSLLGQLDEKGVYKGARDSRFRIFPGSQLQGSTPKWLIAAEIAETSRVYARCVAGVSPQWLEQAGKHLLRRSYSDPYWDPKRGEAMVLQRSVLYGLTLSEGKAVRLSPQDPELARLLFLRDGLLAGALQTPPEFVQANLAQVREVARLEAKGRRRDLLATDDALIAFYDERLPKELDGVKALQRWLRKATPAATERLQMSAADVRNNPEVELSTDEFPAEIKLGELALRVGYKFAPGTPDDGVNVTVPLGLLGALPTEPFDWLVPGFLAARCEGMIRTLPKRLRRQLAPVPDHVAELLPALQANALFRQGRLQDALSDQIQHSFGVQLSAADWDLARLEPHLKCNFLVTGRKGKLLASGRDLAALQSKLLEQRFEASADSRASFEETNLTEFPVAGVPATRHLKGANEQLLYPALVDRGESVALVMCSDPVEAQGYNISGYARLARLQDARTSRYLIKLLRSNKRLGLYYAPFGTAQQLEDRVLNHLYWQVFFADQPLPTKAAEFTERIDKSRAELVRIYQDYETILSDCLAQRFAAVNTLDSLTSPAYEETVRDAHEQLTDLFGTEFPQGVEWQLFKATPGYLKGLSYRLDHLQGRVNKDALAMRKLREARATVAKLQGVVGTSAEIDGLNRALQEWRLLLFAQSLGLHNGISEKKFTARVVALEQRYGKAGG